MSPSNLVISSNAVSSYLKQNKTIYKVILIFQETESSIEETTSIHITTLETISRQIFEEIPDEKSDMTPVINKGNPQAPPYTSETILLEENTTVYLSQSSTEESQTNFKSTTLHRKSTISISNTEIPDINTPPDKSYLFTDSANLPTKNPPYTDNVLPKPSPESSAPTITNSMVLPTKNDHHPPLPGPTISNPMNLPTKNDEHPPVLDNVDTNHSPETNYHPAIINPINMPDNVPHKPDEPSPETYDPTKVIVDIFKHKVTPKREIFISTSQTTVIIERKEKTIPKIAKEMASLDTDEVSLFKSKLFRWRSFSNILDLIVCKLLYQNLKKSVKLSAKEPASAVTYFMSPVGHQSILESSFLLVLASYYSSIIPW